MKKLVIYFFILIFSLFHLVILIKKICYFNLEYIKFGKIDLVNEFHFEKLYYLYLFIEFILSIAVFFITKELMNKIFGHFLFYYTSLSIAYFIYMNFFFMGCIDCNFSSTFFSLSSKYIVLLDILFLVAYEGINKYLIKNQ